MSNIDDESSSALSNETVQSTESKSTFESLREAITHPIATITEKIQSVISSSTSEEHPSLSEDVGEIRLVIQSIDLLHLDCCYTYN